MNGREQDQPRSGQERGGRRRHGPPSNEPRRNEVFEKFKELIKIKGFGDDEVMQLGEPLGKSFVVSQRSQRERDTKENTKNQVRKFYNLVRVTNNLVNPATAEKSDDESARQPDPRIKLRTLQAQVAYAAARGTISPDFKEFFDVAINKIIESQELKKALGEFTTFFEAFYAYFYFYTEVRR